MEKKLSCFYGIMTIAVIVAYCCYVSYPSLKTSSFFTSNLLLENIEALSKDTGDGEATKCGTKTKEYTASQLIKCPDCGNKTGFMGFVYSYQKKGDDHWYKEGSMGKDYACTPNHGTSTDINTVKESLCP